MRKPLALANWLLVICLALVAAYGTYLIRNYPVPPELEWLAIVADNIQLPAVLVSAIISGNFHAPPDLLHYGLVFLTYVLLFAAVSFLIRRNRLGVPRDA